MLIFVARRLTARKRLFEEQQAFGNGLQVRPAGAHLHGKSSLRRLVRPWLPRALAASSSGPPRALVRIYDASVGRITLDGRCLVNILGGNRKLTLR